ncbi:MAG: efflux RND transporter periplasmic adaptor subunit [Magnetococcales bacterium]|nr:efflux RND transporter periplasmic adaptor subunit [Magnetococcales bacterium]
MKRTVIALLLPGLLLGGVLQAAPETPATGDKAVLTVESCLPVLKEWPEEITASGGVFAWQEAIVAAELGGLALQAVRVDVGSVVKKGQELARLSDEMQQAAVALQQANAAKARVALEEARGNAQRARQVKGSGALSEQQINQYLLAEKSAAASLAASEASLRLEETRLKQTRILAADDGLITARNATLGAVVGSGAELFRLLRQNRLEWRAEVTASLLPRLQPGQTARLTLSSGQETSGTVRQIAPSLDAASRKALVYLDLPPDTPARAGMFAQGFIRQAQSPALTLPQSALVFSDGHRYVFTLDADLRVSRRKVAIGRSRENAVEILSGLEPGQKVVASGGAFLHEGDRVRLASGAAP